MRMKKIQLMYDMVVEKTPKTKQNKKNNKNKNKNHPPPKKKNQKPNTLTVMNGNADIMEMDNTTNVGVYTLSKSSS